MGNTPSLYSKNSITFLRDFEFKVLGKSKVYDVFGLNMQVVAIPCLMLKNPAERTKIKHPNFLSGLAWESEEEGQGSSKSTFFFEFVSYSIFDMMQLKIQKQEWFSESEIIKIVKEVLEILTYLHKNDIYIGNIEPSTLFHDPKHNCIKIYDNSLILGQQFTFHKLEESIISIMPSSLIVSPEILESFMKRVPKFLKKHMFSNDIFCLGITLLLICTLNLNWSSLIDKQNLKVNNLLIDQTLQNLTTLYSKDTVNILKLMITQNPESRPSAEQLLSKITSIEQYSFPQQILQIQHTPTLIQQQQGHHSFRNNYVNSIIILKSPSPNRSTQLPQSNNPSPRNGQNFIFNAGPKLSLTPTRSPSQNESFRNVSNIPYLKLTINNGNIKKITQNNSINQIYQPCSNKIIIQSENFPPFLSEQNQAVSSFPQTILKQQQRTTSPRTILSPQKINSFHYQHPIVESLTFQIKQATKTKSAQQIIIEQKEAPSRQPSNLSNRYKNQNKALLNNDQEISLVHHKNINEFNENLEERKNNHAKQTQKFQSPLEIENDTKQKEDIKKYSPYCLKENPNNFQSNTNAITPPYSTQSNDVHLSPLSQQIKFIKSQSFFKKPEVQKSGRSSRNISPFHSKENQSFRYVQNRSDIVQMNSFILSQSPNKNCFLQNYVNQPKISNASPLPVRSISPYSYNISQNINLTIPNQQSHYPSVYSQQVSSPYGFSQQGGRLQVSPIVSNFNEMNLPIQRDKSYNKKQ